MDGPRILSAGQRYPITIQASSPAPRAAPYVLFGSSHRASGRAFNGGVVDRFHDGTVNLEPAPELMVANHLNEVLLLTPDAAPDEVMALVKVRPTKPDVLIARTVARNTNHRAEVISRGLTWGADEKILLLLATGGWVATRGRSQQLQRAGNHALLVAVTASLMPHAMKSIFDQTRPDRKTVLARPCARRLLLRQARRCIPVRARPPHGRAGFRCGHPAASAEAGDPDAGGRSFADADRRAGALGQRCGRGLRARRRHGTAVALLDGLFTAIIDGGRTCPFLRT